MRSLSRNDYIQQGPLYSVIMTLSVPLMISNLIQTVFDLVTALWLGKLGEAEFAATTFVWPVTFLFVAVGFGLYVAGASILARRIGAGKTEEAEAYANYIFRLTLYLGVSFAIAGFLLTPLIVRMMGASGDLYTHSVIYLKYSFLGFPFIAIFFSFQAILNAQGFTREMMLANGISLGLNILIAPFFIFDSIPFLDLPGMNLGVMGAALSIVVSKAFLMFLGFLMVSRKSRDIHLSLLGSKRIPKEAFFEIIKVAFPAMIGQGGAAAGFIVLHAFIASYGTSVVAAFGLVNRVTAIIMQPAMGIGGGLTAIIGQNLGKGALSRVFEAFRKANWLNLAFTLSGMLIFYFFGREILSLFIKDGEESKVLSQSMEYLYYILPTTPLLGMFSIFQGLYQGSGFTHYSMYMEVGRLWAIRLPLILFFRELTDIGSTGIWIAMTTSNFLIILYGFWLYRRKRWVGQHQNVIGYMFTQE